MGILIQLMLWAEDESTEWSWIMPLFWGGNHVWPRFYQLFYHQNGEFLCSLERKFPEFFKTHPTFVFSPLLMPSMACQTLIPLFFWTPCNFGFSHDPGSQPGQAKPYQTKPTHFRPFYRLLWVIFEAKVPKSKWIWFWDTYPLNQWVVQS